MYVRPDDRPTGHPLDLESDRREYHRLSHRGGQRFTPVPPTSLRARALRVDHQGPRDAARDRQRRPLPGPAVTMCGLEEGAAIRGAARSVGAERDHRDPNGLAPTAYRSTRPPSP